MPVNNLPAIPYKDVKQRISDSAATRYGIEMELARRAATPERYAHLLQLWQLARANIFDLEGRVLIYTRDD